MKTIFRHLFRQMDVYDIDLETLYKMKAQGAKIVDVRSSREYSEGHIAGSINIPDYEIRDLLDLKEILDGSNEVWINKLWNM